MSLGQVTYTGNDYNYLWNRGKNSLEIINTDDNSRRTIQDFWQYLQKKRELVPLFVLADNKASKLFGIGLEKSANEKILVFYKNNELRSTTPLSLYKEKIQEVYSGEVSRAGKIIFLAGSNQQKASVLAIDFSNTLKIISNIVLSETFQAAKSITRVIGFNTMIVGSYKVVYVIEFKSYDEGFRRINTIENLPSGHITSLFFFTNKIFCYCRDEEKMFDICFEREMDYVSFYYIEHTWFVKKKKDLLNKISTNN